MTTTHAERPPFHWLTEDSRTFLQRGYLLEGVTAEQRIREICEYTERKLGIEGYADKLYDYMSRGWISLSSPVWANYGLNRGLPISCFGSYIPDSMEGILDTYAEVGMMNKTGGGTSIYGGAIRPRGSKITNNGKSDGSFNFLKMYDTLIDVVSQGTTRKGQLAAYIDVEHADIHEWLDIRTEGNPVQLIYWGVCIGNQWWDEMKAGDKHKKEIWAKIINRRRRTGVPYIFWKDNVNQQKPEVYKDKNMEIFASNLCCFVGETKVVVQVKPGENVPENAIYTREMTMREIAEHFDKGNPYPIYAKSLPAVNGRWYNTAFDADPDQHYKLITAGIKTKNSDVVKVTLNDGTTFECTDDHRLALRDGGYIQAKDAIGQVLKGYPSFGGWAPIQDLDKDGFEVLSVEPSREHVAVYDITVEDNHNFYIVDKTTKSEILVHNCEIALPSSEEESFVCCLSSMNLLYFDEWKDTDAVKTLTYFLDCVVSDFVEKGKSIKHLARAVRFAERHRALGIGVLGWHSYLQSKMIPFESFEAMMLNNNIFKIMREKAYEASKELAQRYGEPEVLKGYGRRNTTLLAVAPTKSSSAILGGVSPSIEPYKSNYYVKDLAKLKTVFRNPYLEALLCEKGKNTDEVWEDILRHDGSVQHLDFLTKEEKDVFKTFSEISQLTVIQQAGQRQKYIDQGQSLNVMIHPDTPLMDIHNLYETSKEIGVKGLYYQIGISSAQAYARELLTTCASCEG